MTHTRVVTHLYEAYSNVFLSNFMLFSAVYVHLEANPSGFLWKFPWQNRYMCFVHHISCFVSFKLQSKGPPCVTGSSREKKSLARSRSALNKTKHVFDVLILNWASNKHQLVGCFEKNWKLQISWRQKIIRNCLKFIPKKNSSTFR